MLKRYLAEFLGTFGIVFVPVALAGSAKVSGLDHGLLVAAIGSGLPVMAMIYVFGPISAAHFNPAVTLGFAVARRFPARYVVPYWISQMLGGICAAALASALFTTGPGAHIPADPALVVRNVGTEIAITFLLMVVIIGVATDKRVSSVVPALAIAGAVVFGVLIGGPITGGSMNPARSFGPALFAGGQAISVYWLYLVGPIVGAVLGALTYEAVRLDPESAQSAPVIGRAPTRDE